MRGAQEWLISDPGLSRLPGTTFLEAWKGLENWESVCLEPREVLQALEAKDRQIPPHHHETAGWIAWAIFYTLLLRKSRGSGLVWRVDQLQQILEDLEQ